MDPGSDQENSKNALNENEEVFDPRENFDEDSEEINETFAENSGHLKLFSIKSNS